MHRGLLLPLLLTTFALPAVSSLHSPNGSSQDEAAIRKLATDLRDAFDRAEAATYKALHSENVVVVDLGVVSQSREELVNHFVEDLSGAYKGFKLVSFKVEVLRFMSPTSAVFTVPWEFSVPGQPNVKGVTLFVAGKYGSRWTLDAWHSAALQP